jgi:hypothetical protein
MAKRIIMLLDGTWNDADAGPIDTNIVRLRELIAHSLDRESRLTDKNLPASASGPQKRVAGRTFGDDIENLVFYERGVGTGTLLDRVRGGGMGEGLDANVRRAYKFLSFYYEKGDQIFVFGFSRGAYTARSLVGLIGAAGLLTRNSCSPEREAQVWDFYRTPPDDRLPAIWVDLTPYVHDRSEFRVHCLGVFDTVGALGIPLHALWRLNRDRYQFHSVDLSSTTNVNLHALAIDEAREPFEASVWRKPKFKSFATSTEQVWFAGVHSDIGGGYVKEEHRLHDNPHALDDITLDWMIKRVLAHFPDFPVDPDNCWKNIDARWAMGPQHDSRGPIYKLMPAGIRSIGNYEPQLRWHQRTVCRDRHAQPICEMVHISALERLGLKPAGAWAKYRPPNLISVLSHIDDSYRSDSSPGSGRLRVVDWTGEILNPDNAAHQAMVAQTVVKARGRLKD